MANTIQTHLYLNVGVLHQRENTPSLSALKIITNKGFQVNLSIESIVYKGMSYIKRCQFGGVDTKNGETFQNLFLLCNNFSARHNYGEKHEKVKVLNYLSCLL